MESTLTETMKKLRAEGKSFREIAAEIGLPVSRVFRALAPSNTPSDSATAQPDTSADQVETPSEHTPLAGQVETPPETASRSSEAEQPRSAALRARLTETREQLAQLETALSQLPAEKERLLSADTVDRHALEALEERETQLTKDVHYLRQRLPHLERQQEEAEREEASARLAQLPAEAEALHDRAFLLYLELIEQERAFTAKLQELAQCYATERELQAEERYLAVRFALPRVRPHMPPLDAPRGQFQDLRDALTFMLGRAVTGDGSKSPWDAKLDAWEQAGRPTLLPKAPKPTVPAPPPPQAFPVTLKQGGGTATVTVRDLNGDGKYLEIIFRPSGRGFQELWTFSDLRAGTMRGDLPEWVEQVPPLKEFVDTVRAGRSEMKQSA